MHKEVSLLWMDCVPIDCEQVFVIFVIINCLQQFFGATGRAGNTLIHFRCVSPEDKPVSVGLLEFCLCAFAFIPAPLVYGYLIGMYFYGNIIDISLSLILFM